MRQKRQVQIMGSPYYPGANGRILNMGPGQPLRAEREPDNAYDKNAVSVYIGRQKLGHFPRGFASEVAPLMDAGTAEMKVYKSNNIKFMGVGIIVVEWEDGKTE
jgi:hypothetical protein